MSALDTIIKNEGVILLWRDVYTKASAELAALRDSERYWQQTSEQERANAAEQRERAEKLRATVEQLTAERDAFAAENDAIHRAINEICGTDTSTIDAVQHVVERCNEQARQLEEARKVIERCAAYIGSIDHGENTKSYMVCNAWLAANAPAPQRVTVEDERVLDE